MYTEEQIAKYIDDINGMPVGDAVIDYVKKHIHDQNFNALLEYVCNDLLDIIQRQYYKYDDLVFQNSVEINIFTQIANLISTDDLPYYRAIAEFFKGNKQKTIHYIYKAHEHGFFFDGNEAFTDVEFANCFLGPFKAGFPGFWDEIYKLLSSIKVEQGVLELCKAVPLFYSSTNLSEIRSALEEALNANPDSIVVKELLAITLYDEKLWGNAVALFEQLNGDSILLYPDHMYFLMGWCYGKLKETRNEITAYEKSAELHPAGNFTMNNLGYAYYKAKQYSKALECFKKCLDNGWEVKFAADNYVRTLLAMGRYKDAKEFVQDPPSKIHKALLERVKSAENSNQRIKAKIPIDMFPGNDIPAIANKDIDFGVKKQQFTSEKILEDELTLRIESGLPVFGKHLKILRRKGVYGRQYVLSNGRRPDLLAEDTENNLYVIELKKDSGYDDAYEQTADYLEWFDQNWSTQFNSIYGIICLNNPTQDLLDKVHRNDRIRVFEYQISYTER
jgi:tetratricopeptide (TPR) repeat protein